MAYKCKHFKIYELVHPVTYKKYGQMCWKFFDPRVLEALDILRLIFGSITVNDWKWGGKFKWSGLRVFGCGYGTEYSAHQRGSAIDAKSKKYSGIAMRRLLKKYDRNQLNITHAEWKKLTKRFFELINEIELGTKTWLHIAVTNRTGLRWIPLPKKGKK